MSTIDIFLSTLLSFLFPGLGQLWQGRHEIGKKYVIVGLILWLSCIGTPFAWIFHLYAAFEAFHYGIHQPPQNQAIKAAALALMMMTAAGPTLAQPAPAAITRTKHSPEYYQGYRAYFKGLHRLADNPYPVGGARNASWDRGWVVAKRSVKARAVGAQQ